MRLSSKKRSSRETKRCKNFFRNKKKKRKNWRRKKKKWRLRKKNKKLPFKNNSRRKIIYFAKPSMNKKDKEYRLNASNWWNRRWKLNWIKRKTNKNKSLSKSSLRCKSSKLNLKWLKNRCSKNKRGIRKPWTNKRNNMRADLEMINRFS
jgi:hypothetical protein